MEGLIQSILNSLLDWFEGLDEGEQAFLAVAIVIVIGMLLVMI